MDWECSTYGEEYGCLLGLVRKSERRDHLKDLGVDGRIILKCKMRKLDGDLK
jgi:hypothetical protein